MTFTGIGHDVTTRKAIDRARTFTFVDRQSFEEDGVVDAVELHAYAGTVTVVTSLHVENVYHGNLHSQSQCIQRWFIYIMSWLLYLSSVRRTDTEDRYLRGYRSKL